MITLKITVSGRVTGVGFRYSALAKAERYKSIKGWIRNCDPNTVEALIQGEKQEIESFFEWLRRGPPGTRVDSCRREEVEQSGALPDFHIKP